MVKVPLRNAEGQTQNSPALSFHSGEKEESAWVKTNVVPDESVRRMGVIGASRVERTV